MMAIGARYRHGALSGDLADDLPWARSMVRALVVEVERLPPFARDRMALFTAQSLDPVPELRAAHPAAAPDGS